VRHYGLFFPTACIVIFLSMVVLAEEAPENDLQLEGYLGFSFQIYQGALPTSWTDTTRTIDVGLSLENESGKIGDLSIKITLQNVTPGELTVDLQEGISTFGQAKLNITFGDVTDVIQFDFYRSEDIKAWSFVGEGVTRVWSFNLVQNGTAIGQAIITPFLNDFAENTTTPASIKLQGSAIGTAEITNQVTVVMPETNTVTNLFAGFVTTADNKTATHGEIKVRIDNSIVDIASVRENGTYTAEATGPLNSTIQFFIDDIFVTNETLINETAARELNLTIPLNSSAFNFRDKDKDGVPDELDKCPDSRYLVDSQGCACYQIKCPAKNHCKTIANVPRCVPDVPVPKPCKLPSEIGYVIDNMTTFVHDRVVDERIVGLIIGTSNRTTERVSTAAFIESDVSRSSYVMNATVPGSIGTNVSVQLCLPDTCLDDKPSYSDENLNVIKNCQKCGCPDGFECEGDGNCYKTLNLTGLRCLINDYDYGQGLSCGSLNGTFKDVQLAQYLHVSVGGLGPFNGMIKKDIQKAIRSYNLCINTQDIGCVLPDVKCFGEELVDKNKQKVQSIIQQEVNSVIKKSIPSIAKFLGLRVRVNVDFSSLNSSFLRIPYNCTPIKVSSDLNCKPLIINGELDKKADIVFIGDGFFDPFEFEATVRKVLDYEGSNGNTSNEGLFSAEPFKSNKEKFNIYTVLAKDMIHHIPDPYKMRDGLQPDNKDVQSIANVCKQRDYIIVLSKQYYRSNCGFGAKDWPCFVSLASESFPGRLVLHEFGHGFASLGDEYTNFIGELDAATQIEYFTSLFLSNYAPNCRADQEEARKTWGDLIISGGSLGYYPGCGGDCGQSCSTFVRPTFNSVMNDQRRNCVGNSNTTARDPDDANCPLGPPFEPWYSVNSREVLKELGKFT